MGCSTSESLEAKVRLMATGHDTLSLLRLESLDLVDSHDQVVLSRVVQCGAWSLARRSFIENKFADFRQIHEQCGLVIELTLEVFAKPGPVSRHNIKIDG